jgi:hypothetical protein
MLRKQGLLTTFGGGPPFLRPAQPRRSPSSTVPSLARLVRRPLRFSGFLPPRCSYAEPDPWPRKVTAASQARAQRRPSPAPPTQASVLPFSLVAEALQGAARQRPCQGTPPPDQIRDQGTCCRPKSASSTSWRPPSPPRRRGRIVAVPPASPLPRQPPLGIGHLLPVRTAAQQCPAWLLQASHVADVKPLLRGLAQAPARLEPPCCSHPVHRLRWIRHYCVLPV